jgi:hypothetical protein
MRDVLAIWLIFGIIASYEGCGGGLKLTVDGNVHSVSWGKLK